MPTSRRCSLLFALRAGEPYRVARAVAMEIGFTATSGGPTRRRTEMLALKADALAGRLNIPHVTGLSTLTKGIAAWLNGRWHESYELSREAEHILRDQCSGVTWEQTSAQLFWMGSLLYLGEIKTMAEQRPILLEQAHDRGNLYAETNLRTRFTELILLAADQPEDARREITDALSRWTAQGFHLQHYYAAHSLGNIDLYTGLGDVAWDKIGLETKAMAGSLLSRIQVLRIESRYLHARAALTLAAGGKEPAHYLKIATQDARKIAGEHMAWSDPIAELLLAGAAQLQERTEVAVEHLRRAITGFGAAQMGLLGAAAQRALGRLLGGDEGAQLRTSADAWFTAQSVRNIERLTATISPGFA